LAGGESVDRSESLMPRCFVPGCDRPTPPGTRSDPFPLRLIVTGFGVYPGLLGVVN
jgi:hypothetical protein